MSSRPAIRRPVLPTLPPLILARDHAPGAVRLAVASGRWVRVGRGAYLAADAAADPRLLALGRVRAAHDRVAQDHWFSHESAALL
ncbi:hypothetical protein ACFUMH_11920 [Cellulomonas sp. NPDC057328]|uniref:hypothetical protein n=1 Tax=Cellulomonas sp. NPDC057328 TaxID=3346101 RepID=UPI00362ABFE0